MARTYTDSAGRTMKSFGSYAPQYKDPNYWPDYMNNKKNNKTVSEEEYNRLREMYDTQLSYLNSALANQQMNYESQLEDMRHMQFANQGQTDKQSEYDAQIAALKEEYDKQLSGLNDSIASQKADYEKQLSGLNDSIASQKAGYESQISGLKSDYDKQISGLNESLTSKNNQIAALEEQQKNYDAEKQALWDSLDYTYGKQIEKSNKAYEKEQADTDRAMLGRGMQRSSYGAQTVANIGQKKLEAANDLRNAQSAEYNSKLIDLKKDLMNAALQKQQLDLTREQFDKELGFKQSEAAREQGNTVWNQNFQQSEADRAQGNTEWSRNYQAGRDTVADEQWGKTFEETVRSNKAQEDYRNATLEEQIRSNQANEAQAANALAEEIRSAQAAEEANANALAEQIRANQADEAYKNAALEETTRSNKADEELSWAEYQAKYGTAPAASSGSSSGSTTTDTTQTGLNTQQLTQDAALSGVATAVAANKGLSTNQKMQLEWQKKNGKVKDTVKK